MKVEKRDGAIQQYNFDKIEKAIKAVFSAINEDVPEKLIEQLKEHFDNIIARNRADYVRHMATEKGLNVNVINAREMLYRQHGVVHEKYLVDELGMFMASLGIVGYSDGLEAQDKLLKEREVIKKDVYNLQELWKRARAGEKLTEAELNFLLADCWDERNILSE